MDYNIGESTLETLPGTVTPPTAIYSPPPKLTDSCIQNSCTSTPLNFGKHWSQAKIEAPLFNQELTLKLEALAKKKWKKVTFKIDSLQTKKLKRAKFKKRVKSGYRKKKILYTNYCKYKSGEYKLINPMIARQFRVRKRSNEGDLII